MAEHFAAAHTWVYYRDFSVDKKTAYVIIVDLYVQPPSIRWVPRRQVHSRWSSA